MKFEHAFLIHIGFKYDKLSTTFSCDHNRGVIKIRYILGSYYYLSGTYGFEEMLNFLYFYSITDENEFKLFKRNYNIKSILNHRVQNSSCVL
jgi:hypothetical protein